MGWQNIYNVINAVITGAHQRGLTVHEIDVDNEADFAVNTVLLRLVNDNKQGDTGQPYILDALNYYMGQSGYPSLHATYSAAQYQTINAYDCGSWYGDSARVFRLSAVIAGVGGGKVGLSSTTATNGLYCSTLVPADAVSQSRYYSQATILDVHIYNVNGSQDASVDFNDVKTLINSYGPKGWRGSNPNIYGAEVMLGETHSGTTAPSFFAKTICGTSATVSCECYAGPAQLPGYMINGFNESALASSNTTVFRPWLNMAFVPACYPQPTVFNPPYAPTP